MRVCLLPEINTRESDIALRVNSNTLGGLLQGGYKANYGHKWWRVRAGIENNADYSERCKFDSNGRIKSLHYSLA